MVRYCTVYGCLENCKTDNGRRFFRFPADELRCLQWLQCIGRMDLESKSVDVLHSSYFVCDRHFVPSDLRRKYLKPDAIPSLMLPQPENPHGNPSKYTQTSDDHICAISSVVSLDKNIIDLTEEKDSLSKTAVGIPTNSVNVSHKTIDSQTNTLGFSQNQVGFPTKNVNILGSIPNKNILQNPLGLPTNKDDVTRITVGFLDNSVSSQTRKPSIFHIEVDLASTTNDISQNIVGSSSASVSSQTSKTCFPQKTVSAKDTLGITKNVIFIPQKTVADPQNLSGLMQNTLGLPKSAVSVPQNTVICLPENTVFVPQNTVGVPQTTTSVPQNPVGVQNTIQPQESVRRNVLVSCNHTQTTKKLAESLMLPMKRKFQAELSEERKKIRALEAKIKEDAMIKDNGMPPALKKIIERQNVLKCNHPGNRYDEQYIMFALNIYFASPVAYRILSKILCLPSKPTITKRSSFNICTKFDKNVIKCLQYKIRKFSQTEKYCIICADEIKLKRHLNYEITHDKIVGFEEIDEKQTKNIATKSFVVMARGIFSIWQQTLAFCFLSDNYKKEDLIVWVENIIEKMNNIGFNVRAFTSDLKFMDLAKIKYVSTGQPYFYVDNKKIYFMYDVPRLLKSLRDCLTENDFIYYDAEGYQVASWNDIEKMYDIEKDNDYRTTIKLTESHIRPNNVDRGGVKYAAQVLSRTVAVAIHNLVQVGKLPDKSIGSTKFIELINNMFDILNSSKAPSDYKYKKAFIQEEYQVQVLEKAQNVFSELRIINRESGDDVTHSAKFIEGFIVSIRSILCLASDLKEEHYKILYTRRFSLDAFDTLFAKVRKQCGMACRQPLPFQFQASLRKLMMGNIINHSESAKREEDLDQLLLFVEQAQSSFNPNENSSEASRVERLQIGVRDFNFELPKENALTYFCGYLLKKCYENHNKCETFSNYINVCGILDGSLMTSANAKTDELIIPPEDFKQYISDLKHICEDFLINGQYYHVGNEALDKLQVPFNLPCPCFPLLFLKKLLVRFLIYNTLSHNNKNFRNKKVKDKKLSLPQMV